MKVIINTNDSQEEINVEISCKEVTEHIRKLKSHIELFDMRVEGKCDGQRSYINAKDIFYIEAVENKTFIYTYDKVFEATTKLYEFEIILDSADFFRCSKSMIVNINQIKELRPEISRNIRATMVNDEIVIISRRYVKAFNEIISGGRK